MGLKCLLLILTLFIIGCSVPDVTEAPIDMQPAVENTSEPPENIVVEVDEQQEAKPVENIVFIKTGSFSPENMTIYKGESITWVASVDKISKNQPRKIACYKEGYRIYLGERLIENGQKSEFTFDEPGEYLCQEFIYGLRGNIKVKSFERPQIVGSFIDVAGGAGSGLSFAVFVMIMVFLGIYLKRKKLILI